MATLEKSSEFADHVTNAAVSHIFNIQTFLSVNDSVFSQKSAKNLENWATDAGYQDPEARSSK